MMKPAMPAFRPWSSACLPRVAETCERETSVSFSGRAPIFRTVARSCADLIVNEPEICAPVEPSMPSEFSRQLMYGAETSSLSRAIAKCCDVWSGSPPRALSAPRCATRRVIAWNASRPLSVKLKVTIGSLPMVVSKLCSGSLMSVPERPGRSWMTHQRSGSGSSGSAFCSRRTRTPAGTSMNSALACSASVSESSAAWREENVCAADAFGPNGFFVPLSKAYQRGSAPAWDGPPGESSASGSSPLPTPTLVHFDALLDGCAETTDRLTLIRVLVRIGLAVLVEEVGFPVVEVQLGG